MQNAMQNLCRIRAENLQNPYGINAESIYALSMLDSMQHANFTQTSMQKAMRNPCESHAESICALSMLDSMQHADFTQISMQNAIRNRCGSYLCLIHA